MTTSTDAMRTKFCSSCFRYRPAEDVRLATSANGKQRLLRCNICDENRKKAKAASAAERAAKASSNVE